MRQERQGGQARQRPTGIQVAATGMEKTASGGGVVRSCSGLGGGPPAGGRTGEECSRGSRKKVQDQSFVALQRLSVASPWNREGGERAVSRARAWPGGHGREGAGSAWGWDVQSRWAVLGLVLEAAGREDGRREAEVLVGHPASRRSPGADGAQEGGKP